MERKIGEIFEYNGEWYQCVNQNGCCNCAFYNTPCHLIDELSCNSLNKKRKEKYIFKKLEKVGEPYTTSNDKVMQNYLIETEVFGYPKGIFILTNYGQRIIAIEIKQTNEDMEEKNNGNTPLNVLTDKYVNGDICYDDFEKEVKALYSCKEGIKPTLKEFDLEAAKSGKPVCTRDGRKARIICFDTKGSTHPIVALIEKDEKEVPSLYMLNGKKYEDEEEWKGDLMMFPEKKEGWAKVRKDINLYDTKEEADRKMIGNDEYVTAKVCWEE